MWRLTDWGLFRQFIKETQKLFTGELLLEDRSIVFGPKSNVSEPICIECSSRMTDQQSFCIKCRMPKCQACQHRHHTERECRMLKMFLDHSGTENWSESEMVLVLKSLTPLRLQIVQLENDFVNEKLQFLMDHLAERNQVLQLFWLMKLDYTLTFDFLFILRSSV